MCVTGLKTEKWFEERKNMLDDIYRRYNDITIWLTNDGNNRFAVKVSITRIMILMKEMIIGKTNGLITGFEENMDELKDEYIWWNKTSKNS